MTGIQSDPRRIVVAGDWHGNTEWAEGVIEMLPDMLPDESPRVILHLGDFGIWPGPGGEGYLDAVSDALREVDGHLFFVDGNHEWHTDLAARRMVAPAGMAVEIEDRIWWLPRGHRWTWHGRTWLALGGAASVDHKVRVEGVSWWPEEEISLAQAQRVIAAGRADVMVTHDCPAGVPLDLPRPAPSWWDLDRAEAHQELLATIVRDVQPQWLMHGHYHLRHRTNVDLGYGQLQVVGLDCDGALSGNYAVLDVETMKWWA